MAITHLRHVGIFSPDLNTQREFYGTIWGLDQIGEESDAVYFRGASPEHHLLTFMQPNLWCAPYRFWHEQRGGWDGLPGNCSLGVSG
jgi:catechol 2,3-dioxygenase-like lactoylglutathione lyase family enzyme